MLPGVLVVNSDSCLGSVTARNLKQTLVGVDVFTALSRDEALRHSHVHPPSVVVVERVEAGEDGLSVIKDLRTHIPGLRGILISTHSEESDVSKDLYGFLAKPYEIEALVNLVRGAIESLPHAEGGTRPHGLDASARFTQSDFNQLENRLQGLLAGIRAFGAELRCVSGDSEEVQRALDEYVDRLCRMVRDVAEAIKRGMEER